MTLALRLGPVCVVISSRGVRGPLDSARRLARDPEAVIQAYERRLRLVPRDDLAARRAQRAGGGSTVA